MKIMKSLISISLLAVSCATYAEVQCPKVDSIHNINRFEILMKDLKTNSYTVVTSGFFGTSKKWELRIEGIKGKSYGDAEQKALDRLYEVKFASGPQSQDTNRWRCDYYIPDYKAYAITEDV